MADREADSIIHKITVIIVFILMITIPLILQKAGELTNQKYDHVLKGYTEKSYQRPVATVAGWMSGDYQKQYTEWVDNDYTTRAFCIKNYNQLRYSLLKEGIRIIGKHDDLYEAAYINAELCLEDKYDFSLKENQDKADIYISELEELDKKLKDKGKRLFFYITPSKAHYYEQNIPDKYFLEQKNKNSITGYEYLSRRLKETDLLYLDTNELHDIAPEGADFYTTGIHWARPYEQISDSRIIDLLEENSDCDYEKITLGRLNSATKPYWRDSDVYDLLNIYTKPELTYYEYESGIQKSNDSRPLRVLMQGGSFSQGLQYDYFSRVLDSSCYNFFYRESIADYNTGEIRSIKQWSDVDFQKLLDGSDWVIIELNEALISSYSDGFVHYLNTYLDSYQPQAPSYFLDSALIPESRTGLSRARGYYNYEGSYCWTTDDSCLNLYNEKIKDEGLQIDLFVPGQILSNGSADVSVYVNGRHCFANSYTLAGDHTIEIPPDEIRYDRGMYSIEITCSSSFNPSLLGINADNRKLSLQIKYAGEKK